MTNDTIRQSQNHAWSRSHREHAHTTHADLIACDEELAYAIDADDYETWAARDLTIGMVIRWDEYTDLTVMEIKPFGKNDRDFLITLAGDLHPSTGIDPSGELVAHPGRLFQVYNG